MPSFLRRIVSQKELSLQVLILLYRTVSKQLEVSLEGVIFLVPTARSVPERCHLPCAEYCPRRTLPGRCVFPYAQAPRTKVSGRYFVFLCAEQWPKESSVWRMSPSVPTLCAKWPSKRSRLWMSSPCQQHSICAEWCSKRNCPWLSSSPCQPC